MSSDLILGGGAVFIFILTVSIVYFLKKSLSEEFDNADESIELTGSELIVSKKGQRKKYTYSDKGHITFLNY